VAEPLINPNGALGRRRATLADNAGERLVGACDVLGDLGSRRARHGSRNYRRGGDNDHGVPLESLRTLRVAGAAVVLLGALSLA